MMCHTLTAIISKFVTQKCLSVKQITVIVVIFIFNWRRCKMLEGKFSICGECGALVECECGALEECV